MKTKTKIVANDLFLGLFDSVKAGDRIAIVDGPGFSGTWNGCSSQAVVTGKGETRWGRFVAVEVEGTPQHIHSFTKTGIGAYYLGAVAPTLH